MLDMNTNILIVGLGLMGGSYAQAFSSLGYKVSAIDINRDSLDFALDKGWIVAGKVQADAEFLKDFDLIIFAVYPHVILDWIKTNQQYLKNGCLLSDVTGVKSCFIYDAQDILRKDLEFIAAHPMAGREVSGVQNSKKEIFEKANFIITPTMKNSETAITTCREIGKMLGFAKISILTPEKHDEMIAFLSQLTHCIAVTLMTCRDSESFTAYTGDSFRDLTRIAKINDEMWSELFLLNQKELLKQMKFFKRKFNYLYRLIQRKDRKGIREMLKESTFKKVCFDKI